MSFTLDDADNSQSLSAGDSFSLTAVNCREDSSLPPVNGSVSMRMESVELDAQRRLVALAVSGSFGNLNAGAGGMNGGFRLSFRVSGTSLALSMSTTDLAITSQGQTIVTNSDLTGTFTPASATYSIEGAIGVNGQNYRLTQTATFSATTSWPTGGSLRLSDAAGDALELKAKAEGRVDFLFYPAGASAPSASLLDQLWTQYQSG